MAYNVGLVDVGCFVVVQARYIWPAFLNTLMNLVIP
jgi:hypothetical protein